MAYSLQHSITHRPIRKLNMIAYATSRAKKRQSVRHASIAPTRHTRRGMEHAPTSFPRKANSMHKKMEQYNRQARDYIFRENNANGRVAGDTIDLHGLFVEEAEDVLEERIKAGRQRGETHLHVIVGKGNHSKDHMQKIKPRVEQVCRQLGLQYRTEENEGRMFVNLQGGAVHEMPPPPQAPSYGGYPGGQQHGPQYGGQHGGQQHGGQYHGGQPHGGQQHGNQQNQQNNQNDEIEQMVKKGLPKLLKMLKCCTVM